jgi:hypothetical protein
MVGAFVIVALILALVDVLLRRLVFGYEEWWAKSRRIAGRIPGFLTVLAIWGALLWYLAPEQGLTSKPIGSLTLSDLAGIILWIWLVITGGRIVFVMLKALRQFDD